MCLDVAISKLKIKIYMSATEDSKFRVHLALFKIGRYIRVIGQLSCQLNISKNTNVGLLRDIH